MRLICFITILLLFGCTSKVDELTKHVDGQIATLNTKLERGELTNAVMVKTYAKSLKATKPEFAELIDSLAKEAEANSPMIQNLTKRLGEVKSGNMNSNAQEQELYALITATDSSTYNDSLIDVVNTLSDLSDGTLPRIKSSETGKPAGSSLVGNPNYGNWQTRNGSSVWEWYGKYAMFRTIMGGPSYYHSWHYNRPWSYYNDYGYNSYGSSRYRNKTAKIHQANQRQIKQYGQQTGRKSSSYGNQSRKTNSSFRPSSTRSSSRRSSSTYGGSLRSGSRSRGGSGGK